MITIYFGFNAIIDLEIIRHLPPAGCNGICLMEYGICKTNLKYLDTKNNPPMEDKWQYYIMLAISNILLK